MSFHPSKLMKMTSLLFCVVFFMIHGSSRRILQFIAASFGVWGYCNRFLRSIMKFHYGCIYLVTWERLPPPPVVLAILLKAIDIIYFAHFTQHPSAISNPSAILLAILLHRPFPHHTHNTTGPWIFKHL